MQKSVVISIRNASKTDFGGGEKVPIYIAREVMKHTKNIKVIVCSHSDKLLDFANDEAIPHMKTWWWSKQNWSGKKALLFPVYFVWQLILTVYYTVLFIRLNPTVVHLQSKDDFIAGTIAAKLTGARVFWSDYADLKHIWKNHKIWYKNPIGKLVYFVARFAETIIVVSHEDKRLILENMPGNSIASKMTIIYNGAFDTYQEVPKNKVFTIVSASRLVVDKGIGELIEAFIDFHNKHAESQLLILGDGPDKERFVKMGNNMPSIKFLGHQKDTAQYITPSHIFAMPTYHEGFSLALVEACMLRMAIVATSIGGNVEIIENKKTGLLVDVKSSEALEQAFEILHKDTTLREKLAANARKEYSDNFNFKNIIVQHFVPLYKADS
jgi:glycosyltransferase involved in cell wall biosynthesis